MAQVTFAQQKHSTGKTRMPSLRAAHGDGRDWSQYEVEWLKFKEWIQRRINIERPGAHYESAEAIRKLNHTIQEVLVHQSLNHQDDDDALTMEWLLGDFDDVFESYASYCESRPVEFSTISKQLTDLKNPLVWATKQNWYGAGVIADAEANALIAKLDKLHSQYSMASRMERKRQSEVDGEPDAKITLQQFHEVIDALEDDLHERLAGVDFADISREDKLEVAECLLMKLSMRGNRGVDLMRIYIGQSEETIKEWVRIGDAEPSDVILVAKPSWRLIVYSSKKHYLHHELNDEAELLDLFAQCFPEEIASDTGKLLFTPAMHGTRDNRSTTQDHFKDSTRFLEYFAIVTKKHMGVGIRPKKLRCGNAQQLQAMNATPEVRQSFSALMGTGVKNLENAYDRRSALEKGFLASEVQRWQFCPLYDPSQQTFAMPALVGSNVSIALARLIRHYPSRAHHFALFQPCNDDEGKQFLELTDIRVRVPAASAELLVPAQIIAHAETGLQLWRSEHATVRASTKKFEALGQNTHEFAVNTRLTDPWELQAKDIVYIHAMSAIAEVKSVDENGLTLAVATELHDLPSNDKMTHYRFTHDPASISYDWEEAAIELEFPLDLTFNASAGHFTLRKSSGLSTV